MGLYHTCKHNPHGYPFVALSTYSITGQRKWKPIENCGCLLCPLIIRRAIEGCDTPLPLEAARLLSDTLSLAELRGHED